MSDLQIFVMHYTKLADRKASILRQFEEQGITDFEFIELYDKDSLSPTQLEKFQPTVKLTEISLFMKHIHVYHQIASHYDEALILEDDVILDKNFFSTLNAYRQQLPSDYNLLFLGDCCSLHVPKHLQKEGQNLYEWGGEGWGSYGASKCTDSYMINRSCAKQFIDYFNMQEKTTYTNDHWINDAVIHLKPRVFWAEPTIVTQGSENNTFPKTCGIGITVEYAHYIEDPK